MTVPKYVVDPGHGGNNAGALSPTGYTREADLTLSVAREAKRINSGLWLTRDSDKQISYADRAKEVGKCDLVICLHYDSTPWAPSKRGLHAYHARGAAGTGALARWAVRHAPPELTGGRSVCAYDDPLTDRDDWKRNAQYLCEVYQGPVVLLELGYLSNRRDLKFLITTHGIAACAELVVSCFDQRERMQGHDAD